MLLPDHWVMMSSDQGKSDSRVKDEHHTVAQLAKVPVPHHQRALDEEEGAEVEQVSQSQAGNRT